MNDQDEIQPAVDKLKELRQLVAALANLDAWEENETFESQVLWMQLDIDILEKHLNEFQYQFSKR